jgi:hypothetical protein
MTRTHTVGADTVGADTTGLRGCTLHGKSKLPYPEDARPYVVSKPCQYLLTYNAIADVLLFPSRRKSGRGRFDTVPTP